MKTYNQYCPIARSSEILAQRWTPLIIRSLLNGPATYTALAEQAPGIPRSLLTSRLRELQTTQLVTKTNDPPNKRNVYELTEVGHDLTTVISSMGEWGERWLDVTPQHADPLYFLNSWINSYLNHDTLPDRRVTVRFEFTDQPARLSPMWVIFDPQHSEVCRTNPGFEEDLIVTAESVALAEWHLGRTEWHTATRSGRIKVNGTPTLAKTLPTWNQRSRWTTSTHPKQTRP